jgi:PAS domain S-box-containing protein
VRCSSGGERNQSLAAGTFISGEARRTDLCEPLYFLGIEGTSLADRERMNSDLYQRVVELLPDALIFADRGGVIRIWNARAEALFGYAADEAIGESLDLIIPEHLRSAHWRGYEAAIASGRTRLAGKAMLTRAMPRNGGKVYVEVAFSIVTDSSGAVMGAVAIGRPSSKPIAPGC